MRRKAFACVMLLALVLIGGCATVPIKGNVNCDGEKIYHRGNCPSYGLVQIDPTEGDKLFATPQEAEQAGFRIAGNCW